MNYTMLMHGDQLPMVGVLQLLLNRTGILVKADGFFGPKTLSAVKKFQTDRLLVRDGIVGEHTWSRLTAGLTLPIIDSVDIYDPTFDTEDAKYLRQAGANPLRLGGMCNGVEQAVSMIAGSAWNTYLLRFHGHGAPGVAGISDGHEDGIPEDSDISANKRVIALVSRLRPIFGPYGCVEFIQCQTGRGPKGRHLLSLLANQLGVPVTAATIDQPFGRTYTFRLAGPTVTMFPGGLNLKTWTQSRPPFVGMTVS